MVFLILPISIIIIVSIIILAILHFNSYWHSLKYLQKIGKYCIRLDNQTKKMFVDKYGAGQIWSVIIHSGIIVKVLDETQDYRLVQIDHPFLSNITICIEYEDWVTGEIIYDGVNPGCLTVADALCFRNSIKGIPVQKG